MGTTKERLIAMIEAQGYTVITLSAVSGYWKSQDVYRWEAIIQKEGRGLQLCLNSWHTMTDCARKGFTIEPDDYYKSEWWLEAHIK